MYKILVADDEPIHRRGILNLIGRLRPHYSLFEARDGEEALQIIDSNDIDIVITDIQMPNKDGLQLIESLGIRVKTMKIVILSAYGYFEYAKKAITLGAFEYVLKPIEESDIEATLYKLEDSMEKDHKIVQERVSMEKRLNHTMPAYLEHLLTKWVGDGLTKVELEEIEKIFPHQGECVVVVSEISKTDIMGTAAISDEIDLTLKYILDEHLKPLGDSLSFYMGGKRNILVSILYANKESSMEFEKIVESVNNCIVHLKDRYGVGMTAGISQSCNHIFKEIQTSFAQALGALHYKFYYGPGSVIPHDHIPFIPNKMPFPKYGEEDALSNAIIQGNGENATLIVEKLFEKMIAEGYQPPNRMKENIVYFVMNQAKKSENLLLKEQFKRFIEQADSVLSNCEYFDDLKGKVNEIISFMITNIQNQKNNKNSAIIKQCKDYIEEHYMEDIPLDTIAKRFYFSPAYFSSFFKNYTGMCFSDFILEVRIKKAKELLIDTDERVYDIASKVGYKDQGYFTKIFKREIGVAPEEFRRNNGNYMK